VARQAAVDRDELDYLGDLDDELAVEYDPVHVPGDGPHDDEDLDPEVTLAAGTVDFGAVRVPVPARGSITVEPSENGRMQAVHVSLPEGRLSVSALAAPKSSKLWPDLANEIDVSLREGGARVRSFTGDWGRELHATSGAATSVFVGVDGSRWMLYGVATGPTRDAAALDVELRRMLRGTIVVRGRNPYPVRTVLPLEMPARLAEQQAGEQEAPAPQPAAGRATTAVPAVDQQPSTRNGAATGTATGIRILGAAATGFSHRPAPPPNGHAPAASHERADGHAPAASHERVNGHAPAAASHDPVNGHRRAPAHRAAPTGGFPVGAGSEQKPSSGPFGPADAGAGQAVRPAGPAAPNGASQGVYDRRPDGGAPGRGVAGWGGSQVNGARPRGGFPADGAPHHADAPGNGHRAPTGGAPAGEFESGHGDPFGGSAPGQRDPFGGSRPAAAHGAPSWTGIPAADDTPMWADPAQRITDGARPLPLDAGPDPDDRPTEIRSTRASSWAPEPWAPESGESETGAQRSGAQRSGVQDRSGVDPIATAPWRLDAPSVPVTGGRRRLADPQDLLGPSGPPASSPPAAAPGSPEPSVAGRSAEPVVAFGEGRRRALDAVEPAGSAAGDDRAAEPAAGTRPGRRRALDPAETFLPDRGGADTGHEPRAGRRRAPDFVDDRPGRRRAPEPDVAVGRRRLADPPTSGGGRRRAPEPEPAAGPGAAVPEVLRRGRHAAPDPESGDGGPGLLDGRSAEKRPWGAQELGAGGDAPYDTAPGPLVDTGPWTAVAPRRSKGHGPDPEPAEGRAHSTGRHRRPD
jgi:hypothetical protein